MSDLEIMRLALRLAQKGYGATSPNPMVGAVLVKGGKIIGRGWHQRAGLPHAEIAAMRAAEFHQENFAGATLFVTLEPCCTTGRTPPCTAAIIAAGIKRVVVAATDPNPRHAGRGLKILRRAGIEVVTGLLAEESARLNEAFNHWIVQRTPFVTVKAAMTLDGKIATARGESKWITGEKARARGIKLRRGADAILVGVNTVIADDPGLTVRAVEGSRFKVQSEKILRRIVLDPMGRMPLEANILNDAGAKWTTIVVSEGAARKNIFALRERAEVVIAPRPPGAAATRLDLRWLLRKLGAENVTSVLVEGGGETNAGFLEEGLAQRIVFFYAPKILGGRDARKSVAGDGVKSLDEKIFLREVEWRKLGADLFLTALVAAR